MPKYLIVTKDSRNKAFRTEVTAPDLDHALIVNHGRLGRYDFKNRSKGKPVEFPVTVLLAMESGVRCFFVNSLSNWLNNSVTEIK